MRRKAERIISSMEGHKLTLEKDVSKNLQVPRSRLQARKADCARSVHRRERDKFAVDGSHGSANIKLQIRKICVARYCDATDIFVVHSAFDLGEIVLHRLNAGED